MEHGDAPSGLDLADVGMLEGQSGLNLVLPDDREDLSHIMPADLAKPVQIRGGCSAPTLARPSSTSTRCPTSRRAPTGHCQQC